MNSDRALLKRAQGGDQGAFAALFGRHAHRIARVGYLLMHDWNAAEDILQETFLRGWTKIDTCRGGSPKAWLLSIALNLARNMIRDGRVQASETPPDLDAVHTPRRGVVTSVVRRETGRQLAVALGYLTSSQREVFVLHYVEEMPYEEIAPIRGISIDAARHLAHRAKAVLREKFPRHAAVGRGS